MATAWGNTSNWEVRMDYKQKAFAELNAVIRKCKRCRLYLTRTNVLCGEGNLHALLMLIAQAPGQNEDREGRMFIGPSGKVLDELLVEAGIRRDEIYMTNLIKCRPPKNRRPKRAEIEACSSFLEKEIALIEPKVLVPLGYYSARFILNKYNITIPQSRGEFSGLYGKLFQARDKRLYPLTHPAALLYNRSYTRAAFEKYGRLRFLLETSKRSAHLLCTGTDERK
jgi:DNA polymerase